MGQILKVVAYVSGLRADGSDTQTDYFLKKRAYLNQRAEALADFGSCLISKNLWRSGKPIDLCSSELVLETNLDERPMLKELSKKRQDGEELTLVVVESRDLCRPTDYNASESLIFEEIVFPYLSVVFAGEFSHTDRWSPVQRAKTPLDEASICSDGDKVLKKIMEANPSRLNNNDLNSLQDDLLGHVGKANHILQRFSDRLVSAR